MSIESRLRNYFPYMERFGIRKGMKIAKTLFPKDSSNKIVSIELPNIKHPINIRLGTTDVTNFLANFMSDEFNLPPLKNVKLIIDAGANAGFASIFFLNKYPDATLIAIEPESSNIEALNRNGSPYPHFKSIQSAIWKSNSNLKIINTAGGKTSFQVTETTETGPETFSGTTIDKILDDSGLPEIDILKIDIEGAEKEVFKENYKNWINRTRVIIIELHDRVVPGCGLVFHTAMEKENFAQIRHGKNLVYLRNS